MKINGKDDKQDAIWDMKCEALEKFAYENGHCNIKTGKHMSLLSDGTEANIGTWLNTQRGLKRKEALRDDKMARMQVLVDKGYLSWNCKRAYGETLLNSSASNTPRGAGGESAPDTSPSSAPGSVNSTPTPAEV
jgi:hypothetical protein